MDWVTILEALGGGPGAILILLLGWFARDRMKKYDELASILMERKDDAIRDAERREIAFHQALEAVVRVIEQQVGNK